MASHSSAGLYKFVMSCARRALRGQTPSALRRYSFSFDQADKRILFRAEVGRKLSEDEHEGLAIAETEVYADAIFGEDTKIETLIEVIPMGMPLRPLTNGVVFLRDGEDSPQTVSALPPCQV